MARVLDFPSGQAGKSRPDRIRETLQYFIDNADNIGSIAIVTVAKAGGPSLYTAAETPAMLCAMAQVLANQAATDIEEAFGGIGGGDGDAA